MTRTPAPGPHEGAPRSLSSLLRALDGAPPGGAPGVDLAAAVRDGGRHRRRRRATSVAAGVVAVTAVLALGAGWVGPAPTEPVTATAPATSVTGSADGPTAGDLLHSGWSQLLPGQLETPGTPDDAQPAVLLDPGRSEIAVVIDTGGCWEKNTLEVVSQSAELLELRYVDQDGPGIACTYAAVTATYQLSLSAPLTEGAARVVLELPGALGSSPDGIPGVAQTDPDPGEVTVAAPQVVMTTRSTYPDGTSWDQLLVDAAGARLRLRFAFSICATAVLRPPVETPTQVDLRVVVTDPGTGCVEPFYAEDFFATLDAPLGDRRVVVTEETRIEPPPSSALAARGSAAPPG